MNEVIIHKGHLVGTFPAGTRFRNGNGGSSNYDFSAPPDVRLGVRVDEGKPGLWVDAIPQALFDMVEPDPLSPETLAAGDEVVDAYLGAGVTARSTLAVPEDQAEETPDEREDRAFSLACTIMGWPEEKVRAMSEKDGTYRATERIAHALGDWYLAGHHAAVCGGHPRSAGIREAGVAVATILDDMIRHWRDVPAGFGTYYVDALQSARKNLIGETLP